MPSARDGESAPIDARDIAAVAVDTMIALLLLPFLLFASLFSFWGRGFWGRGSWMRPMGFHHRGFRHHHGRR
jgi:hypothetical protein